ncbi:MAG: phage head closure protein [Roseburia sp.]|nr:phage head closure protein [Roseburia sp.]
MSETARINVIRKHSNVVDGRKQVTTEDFYSCWCKVQSLGTNEKYTALQHGIERTIVFKVRNCKKVSEIVLDTREFFAVYKGTEFKIYDASPMFTDNGQVLLKCRVGE